MVSYVRAVLLLTLVYLALTSNLQASNIVVGVLLAVGVLALLRPQRRVTDWRAAGTAVVAVLRYIFVLAHDMVVSGMQVARIVLDPKLPIQPGIIAIPSGCQSELGTALSAHAITLAPGEMVVEIDDDGVMYTHVLDMAHAETAVAEAQELRVALLNKIFP
ncbi:MAG: Na+/H+ antiporter subunit E [Ardenticatenaceae bacterium]|nr:Na+/H+ antiporter subunit E [Ardenticatenaceae bacterium]MCB8986161.1 Na+/H+ antiporter subunit E [Ardenticatenaceae bacterium]